MGLIRGEPELMGLGQVVQRNLNGDLCLAKRSAKGYLRADIWLGAIK
jgi:hypothetical protein